MSEGTTNIQKGNNFFSNFIHGIFSYHEPLDERNERIEIIAKKINELLERKEILHIPEITKSLNINVIDTLAAIQLLKQRGIVQEID